MVDKKGQYFEDEKSHFEMWFSVSIFLQGQTYLNKIKLMFLF